MNAPVQIDEQISYVGTATYSPEDNKLRIYPFARLDADTYARVKRAGFSWAPRQKIFVAPMWTPARNDLAVKLCGDIGDEDTTLTERAEERAERFDDYSAKREQDGDRARERVGALSANIPLGQPILIGHHSQRRAERDAQKIENGMRHAVKMWETSAYWTDRAAGALAHAKYKELPAVRARRIKGIEADQRKAQREHDTQVKFLQLWTECEAMTDADAQRTRALQIANDGRCRLHLKRKEGDRPDFDQTPSVWTALNNDSPTLYAPRTIAEVFEAARAAYPRSIAHSARWLSHYANRLAYERAMLDESGGLITNKFEIVIGGQVLVEREWCTVLKVNKSGALINSVTTNRKYCRVVGIEKITDYKAPSAEETASTKEATKLGKLCNYPGDKFIHITQAQWDKSPKDHRGFAKLKASDTHDAHRVRKALGVWVIPKSMHTPDETKNWNLVHAYHCVYITDAKTIAAPTLVGAVPVIPAPVPVPRITSPRVHEQTSAEVKIKQLKPVADAGVKVVSAPQLFPTPPDIAARMVELAALRPGCRVLEPSAGTGRLIDALGGIESLYHIVAIEIDNSLADNLTRRYSPRIEVIEGNFMEVANIGMFDACILNPPFVNAQDVQHIRRAFDLLESDGHLVALCANGPRQNEQLKPWVESLGGSWEVLPVDSFSASGTSVNVAMLVVEKSA